MEANNEAEKSWLSKRLKALETRWNGLSSLQQRVVVAVAIVALETCLVYCCWVAETRGQNSLVIRIGNFHVMAITGIFVCAFPNVLMIASAFEKTSTKIRAFGNWLQTPLRRSASRLTRHVPPLTQAHGYYTVGRDAEARTLAEQVLAQEPENVTAQELLQLIETRQARSKPEPEEKPDWADRLLDSKYARIAANVFFALGVIGSFAGCVYYTYVGFTQGWTTILSQGFNRHGNWTVTRVWEAAGFLAILPTVVLVYGLFHYFPEQMEALLEKGVDQCLAISKWGKSRRNAIRNFVSRMAHSTPSRSSEPKASPASRPSSTTRTRPRR